MFRCFWCALLSLATPGKGVESSNIILIIADAWRYSAFSGSELPDSLALTPRYMPYKDIINQFETFDHRLDAFRAESIDFSRCYSAYPLCTPSRISIQSGLYPNRHNVTKNGDGLTPGTPTLASTLSDIGFDTAHFGKW